MDRRSFALGLSAAAILLPRHSGAQQTEELHAAARREGELVLYTGTLVEVIEDLRKAFEERYPGIRTQYWRGDTSQVTQRFETEYAANRHTADILLLTDRQSKILHARGMTQPYRSVHLDRYQRELHAKDDAYANYALTLASFAWNTRLVPAGQEPKAWEDLLDPRWQGRMAIQDPLQAGGAGIWFITLYEVWGEQKWADYFQRLGRQRLRYGRYLQVQEMLSSGEVAIQVAAYPNYIEPLKARGGTAEWGVPDPVIWTGLSASIPSRAPHPAAAKLWVDFMLSPVAQARLNSLGLLPALRTEWPAGYRKLEGVRLYPQAHELEAERLQFFQAKMREYFLR
ncbi:MAG TPA: extracellular solute-binding protein [Falsiroseomonas sp.]|jgi:iron(III) transport system substrate-binding protein|nr:extracellular solute-binding protein [Falsiroseomonas sp.]